MGEAEPPPVSHALIRWLCAGMLLTKMETFWVPAASPSTIVVRPGPDPAPIGARPRKSGRAKVVVPFPPYVVPRIANSAEYCEIARIYPWQS